MRYCGLPGIEVDGGLALVFEPLAGTPPTTFFFLVGRKGKGVGRGRSTQLFTCSALLSPTAVCRRIQFHLPLCLDSVALSQIARTYKFSLKSGEKPPETMFDESICTKQVTF